MANLTRIKNNQITDSTILANTKIVPGSIVGSLFNANLTMTSDVTITGNLTVQGSSTYLTVASTNTYVNDPLIVMNNAFSGTNTYDIGLLINRGDQTSTAIIWKEANKQFELTYTTDSGTSYGAINNSGYANLKVGNLTVAGVTTLSDIGAGNITLTGDLAVNGGDITTTAGTATVFNTAATTVNAFGAATTLIFGATTGVANIRNATTNVLGNATVSGTLGITGDTTLTGDLAVNGGDITTTSATATVFNTNATTVDAFKAATDLELGATTGTLTINNPTVVGTQTTQNLYNTTATTVNAFGAATTMILGATTGTANIRNATTNIIGNATVGGTLNVTGHVTLEGVTSTGATGSGNLVFSNSPALTSPNIGTPSYANLSSATNLPVSTGISGLAAGVATFLATPNSSNLISAVTDETGSGNLVFSNSPALTSPNIGTPSYANLSSATNLPVSTGISGLAAGVATFLATPSSSNLISAVTDETGTGALVFGTSPTVTTSLIAGGASFDLLNTTATTVNFAGAATTLIVGATTGVANIRNATTNVLGNATVGGTLGVTGAVTLTDDLAVNGGDLTTSASTFNLVNANATTLNLAGAATTIAVGANSGTITIGNPTLVGTQTTQAVYNTTATTVNAFGAATTLIVGAATGVANIRNATTNIIGNATVGSTLAVTGDTTLTGDLAVNGGDLTTTSATATIFNTNATTVDAFKAATDLEFGATTGTLTINNPTVVGTQTTQNLYNTTATTVNAFGAATTMILGATTGVANIRNATTNVLGNLAVAGTMDVTGGVTYTGDIAVNGGDITTTSATATVFNTNATTVDAFKAATDLELGATSGTLTINNPTVVGTQTTQNLYNTTATTLNIGGAATALNLGASSGNTTVQNNLITTGNLKLDATTQSTNTTSGALIVAGGVGVAKNLNVGGNVVVTGDLTVNGNVTTLNTATLDVEDLNITVAKGAADSAAANGAGLTVDGASATILYTHATTSWNLNKHLIGTSAQFSTTLGVTGDTTLTADLAVNGGDLTTSASTFNLVNANATTLNLAGAATTIAVGANSGTITIGNPTLVGTQTTQAVYNTVATTVNAFGAASTLIVGATTGVANIRNATTNIIGNATVGGTLGLTGDVTLAGDLAVNGGDLTTSAGTFNLVNANATTLNLGGAATTIAIGATSGTITIKNPTLVGTETTQNLYNTTATTMNFAGAATTLIVGAATGVANIRNATTNIIGNATVGGTLAVTGDTTLTGDLAVNGGDITTTASTFNLVNANATTVDAFKAATDLEFGATTGTLTINNPTVVGTQTTQAVFNTTATTVNAFGAATTMILGATTGIANIRNATTNIIGNATVGGTLGITGDVTLTGDLAVNGGDLTTTASTATVFNTNATTVNAFGAATTLGIGAGTGNLTLNNATITTPGQIISTRAGSATTGNGQIFLNGATSNRIDWAAAGTGAPAFTTRTAGTKVVLYPALSGSTVDYAIGIDSATMWSSVPENGSSFNFKWYGAETLVANLSGTGNFTTVGDVAVNGGDLTTTAGTFNLVNTTATTVNAFGAATTLIVGAATGVANIRNATTNIIGNATVGGTLGVTGSATLSSTLGVTGAVTLTDDLAVNGGDITTSATTFNLVNANATTLNLAGAATTIAVGATTGTLTINNPTVVGTQTTQAVFNTTATTVNFAGAATTLIVGAATGVANIRNATTNIIGNATVGGTLGVTGAVTLTDDLAVNGGDITTTSATATVFNTNATTVDAFKAATDLEFGATTGTLTINNPTVVGTQTTQAVFNTTATTVNAFGAATTMILGATTGTANIRNATTNVLGNATVAKGITINSTQSAENFLVKGKNSTALIYADSNTDSVIIGGGHYQGSGGNTTVQGGVTLKIDATDALLLPIGTTAQRPGNSGNVDIAGMMRFNDSISNMEFYDGAIWQTAGSVFTVISDRQFADATGNPYGNVNGVNTTFTLQDESTTAATIVSINGVIQIPAIAYDVSLDVLTFTEAPATGDIIDVRLLATTSVVSALTSANGLVQFITTNTEAQIYTGASVTSKKFSIDNNGLATFENDVIIKGSLTVLGDTAGNINIGDSSSDHVTVNAQSVTYTNGTKIIHDQTAVTVNTSAVVIDSFAKATYRSAKYVLSISNSGTGEYETTEVLVIHNGTTATRTQYATMYTGAASLGSVTVAVNGANVELSYQGVASGNAVKLSASYIKV